MFRRLAGIDTDGPGYDRLIIRPMPPTLDGVPEQKPITWVKARYNSIHGRIATDWKRASGQFQLKVTIPAGATATVYLPVATPDSASNLDLVTESGRPLSEAEGVRLLRRQTDCTVLAVESGSYDFLSAGK